MKKEMPTSMNGCGTQDGDCNAFDKASDCHTMVENGYPQAVWIFKALSGFHEYVRVAGSRLTDQTLLTGLGIPQLVEEFSGSPDTDQTVETLSSIIGAAMFLVGGVAGAASLGMGFAATSVSRAATEGAKAGARSAVARADRLASEAAALRSNPRTQDAATIHEGKADAARKTADAKTQKADEMEKGTGPKPKSQEVIETAQVSTDVLGAAACK